MDSHIPCVESRRKIVGYINQVKILRIFGVSSATLFSLILLSSIFPIASHTDHVGAAPETSTTDITMVTGRSSANLDITPNSGAGTFATSTGNNTASFNVTTNSYTGYTLKILGSDTNGQLANAVYNTALSPIDSIIDGDTFAASSSNIYNNKWGIIPSKVNSQVNTNYLPAPVNTGIASTTTEIFMNKTSCANGTSPCSSASDNYTIGIGARIDFTRPAGLYTKSFTLAAVGNPATYTINYSKGDVVDVIEGMPTNATTGSATDPNVTTISLDSATPTRANYDFAGWCLGTLSGTTANPGTTCNGTLITDRIFTLNQASDNEATLYATWTAKKFNITIKTTEGISKVSLNGTECDKTTGCTVANLAYNNTYNLVATPAPGYTFSGWDPVSDGNIANTSNATTTYTVGTADATITPTATINKYNITIKTATGISKVSLNGTECDKTSGCTVPNLTYGQSYELKATVASGYTFSSWNAGAYGSVAANTATTTYTVGVGDSIITPSASVNKYSLTITFAGVGVSSVAVKTGNCSGSTMGTATSSSPTVTNLVYNTAYYLCPTYSADGYSLSSWAKTSTTGTLSSTSATQPTFTMGAGDGAVTITGKANKYTYTERYHLQKADGGWEDYVTTTEQVDYGTTRTFTKSVPDYKAGSASATNGAQGTKSCTVGTSGCTNTIEFYRNTYALTVSKGTGISSVSGDGTYRWGYAVPISATPGNDYLFSTWSISGTTGTLANSKSASTTYTMPKGISTVTATGEAKLYIQNVTASQCTTTARTVYDNRDNQTYVIKKLADGKCWMMTNLNLGAVNLTANLTSANTNISTTIAAATFNGWRKSKSVGTATAAEYMLVSGTDPTSKTPYGTLYNYCAASAGTICAQSNYSNASYDICPKGWRLPTGGSSGEFQRLYNNSSYNSLAKMRAPYTSGGAAFALSGVFCGGDTPGSQGNNAGYWSSTRHPESDWYMLDLYIDTSTVYANETGGGSPRDFGRSIRCVLK